MILTSEFKSHFVGRCKSTHKVYSTKAAMTDLSQVREEFFRVFFKKEICDPGVLQTPRASSVGHAGRGRGRSHQSLSGSATRQPPLMAHLQDSGLIRTNT